jgi:hypothetical protein
MTIALEGLWGYWITYRTISEYLPFRKTERQL